jgi:hypothetical protein
MSSLYCLLKKEKSMKRQILAATLLALQTAAVFAVNPPKNNSVKSSSKNMGGQRRPRTNKASGEMQRGGEHMLAGFATPIKNGDVQGFEKALASYKGGKLGLYALIGKLSIAVEENHANELLDQGQKATMTRHLHAMRDLTMEKIKTHPSRVEGERKPRAMRKSPGARRGGVNRAAGNKRPGAARKAAVSKAASGA